MCHDNPVQFLCAVAQLVTDKRFIRYFMHLGVLEQDKKYSGFWQKMANLLWFADKKQTHH